MSKFRCAHVPGGTFIFTVKTEHHAPIFAEEEFVALLGHVIREAKRLWPFEMNAIVLLPDHLHAIWSLPPGDLDDPKRWERGVCLRTKTARESVLGTRFFRAAYVHGW